jgi:hypothetical protein
MAAPQRYVNLSHVTQQIVLERQFKSDGSVDGDPNLDQGPASAYRDVGAEVLGTVTSSGWEHSYAVMLGRGSGVTLARQAVGVETYAYWSSERPGPGQGVQRDGLKFYGWMQSGQRHLEAGPTQSRQTFARRRIGLGATLRSGAWSLGAEAIEARGMIYHGPDGGTIPGRVSNDGRRTAGYNVLPESRARGAYVDAGWRVAPALALRLRFDRLDRGTDNASTEIRFQGLTLGASWTLATRTQLIVDYQFRRYSAPRLAADNPTNRLLAGVDDRLGVVLLQPFSF